MHLGWNMIHLGWLFWAMVLVLLIGLILAFLKRRPDYTYGWSNPSSAEVLKMRLAKGEISEDEYQTLLMRLRE